MTLPAAARPSRLPLGLALLLLLPPGSARGQGTAPEDSTAASTPAKTQKVADLAGRYRLSERYTSDPKEAGPGLVGAYRVAIREVIRDSYDSAQGAPRRAESTRRAIYAERPAEMAAGAGGVVSASRLVEAYQARPEDLARMMGGRPLEGAAVLIRPKLNEAPLILGLTEGRTLTEYEFDVLAKQAFVPQLAGLLPAQVVRLGDTWRVPRKATQALLGDPGVPEGLVGKLAEIRKEVDGPRMVAAIQLTGKLATAVGETGVNAELLFTFQPGPSGPPPAADPPKKAANPSRPADDVVEGRGAITEVRLASVSSGPLPGPGRLRFQSNREMTLHRQLGSAPSGLAPPAVSGTPPPTEANSWLEHVDASGRYSLRHPQEFQPSSFASPAGEPATTLLIRSRREGRDMLQVEFAPRTLAPEALKKTLAEKYASLKMEVLKGDEAWLPEVDWPGMRVHRVDAALKPKPGEASGLGPSSSTRIHFDGYLIQFPQASSILAIASTTRDAVTPFRREVEQVLRSIKLDPPRPVGR